MTTSGVTQTRFSRWHVLSRSNLKETKTTVYDKAALHKGAADFLFVHYREDCVRSLEMEDDGVPKYAPEWLAEDF